MRRESSGFTLVEIAIAITILGMGMVVLVTLQTRAVGAYLHEEDLLRAALAAQYLMALHEVETTPPEEGSKEGPLGPKLAQAGYFGGANKTDRKLKEELKTWRYSETVTPIALGPFEDALRRIDLVVSWSPAPTDSYRLVYFLKGPAPRLAGGIPG